MLHQRTTGLNYQQFNTLLTALKRHLTWGKSGGGPPALTLTQALKVTLLYYRHNLTEELLAELFTVSQPTISRAINTTKPALEKGH